MAGTTPTDRATPNTLSSLTIVIPAYNESVRLDSCLRAVLAYVDGREAATEVILVDDGSTDDTLDRATRAAADRPCLRVLAIPHQGKAAAVRAGMLAATHDVVLFTDADLATPLPYADDLIARLGDGADVAIASREGRGATRIGEPLHRHLMGRAFNLLVQALLLPGLRDTQCGFKAFRGETVIEILDATRLYRDGRLAAGARVTAFDVELLYIARRLGRRIAVLPVVWSAGHDSKVNPVTDTWTNLTDVLRIRLNGWLGRYPGQR